MGILMEKTIEYALKEAYEKGWQDALKNDSVRDGSLTSELRASGIYTWTINAH
jgi:hypothetical protein